MFVNRGNSLGDPSRVVEDEGAAGYNEVGE